jgi:benzoyl-CoA reductase/2-hydroxyglutaryl-CoA dehydratase subunit BcrC/BadD/HgdB
VEIGNSAPATAHRGALGQPISEAALREAIVLKNRERQATADFYRLGQLNPPALSGQTS